MKNREAMRAAATAEAALGSPTKNGMGTDVSLLYIDMLCDKFKDRGIRTSARADAERQKKKDRESLSTLAIRLGKNGVRADDAKYKTLSFNGRSYMSSDDFAAYYKDLRDYKLPRFYSRAETEYEEADAEAMAKREVQESGKSPKKAVWLAIARHFKSKVAEIPSHLGKEELRKFAGEWFLLDEDVEIREGKSKKLPAGAIPTIAAVSISLFLIVCSSVMVSRASATVSSLEDKIESLENVKFDLEGKLEVKNNMLDIRRIAVEEYGMISEDYASARYVNLKEDEMIETYDKSGGGESWLTRILRAIGLKND